MTEKIRPKLPSGQVVKWKETDCPTFYSNVIGFTLSPFDITLSFGEIGASTLEELNAIPRVKVIVSPEQAANLTKLLTVALSAYVEGNGQLRTGGAVNIDDLNRQIQAQKIVIPKQNEG
jgi:hypothetical protein